MNTAARSNGRDRIVLMTAANVLHKVCVCMYCDASYVRVNGGNDDGSAIMTLLCYL